MARGCGCVGGSCGCALTGGAGVEVSGIGTAADPYEIEAVVSELNGSIQFDDSASIDFTAVGAGTPTDPIVVTAVAKLPQTLQLPSYTTATRPAASTVGDARMIWNTTTSLPNFSDGTNWLDAAGSVA